MSFDVVCHGGEMIDFPDSYSRNKKPAWGPLIIFLALSWLLGFLAGWGVFSA